MMDRYAPSFEIDEEYLKLSLAETHHYQDHQDMKESLYHTYHGSNHHIAPSSPARAVSPVARAGEGVPCTNVIRPVTPPRPPRTIAETTAENRSDDPTETDCCAMRNGILYEMDPAAELVYSTTPAKKGSLSRNISILRSQQFGGC